MAIKRSIVIFLTILLCLASFPTRGFCADDSFYNENETEMITVGEDEQLENRLETPVITSIVQTGRYTFRYEWKEVLGAVSYDVVIYRDNNYDAPCKTRNVQSGRLEITLEAGHEYCVSVRANAYDKSKVHTASEYSEYSESIFIPSLRRIEFTQTKITVAVGGSIDIPDVICTPSNLDEGVSVVYSSSDDTIAKVAASGQIMGCSEGTAQITASAMYSGAIILEMETQLTVSVIYENEPANIPANMTVCAITNVDSTLKQVFDRSNINLENWVLAAPDLTVGNYAGTEYMNVPVYFDNAVDGTRTYRTICMKPVTYTGFEVKSYDGSELRAAIPFGETYHLNPEFTANGDAAALSLRNDYYIDYTYKAYNNNITLIPQDDGSMIASCAKPGAYTVTMACRINAPYLKGPKTVATKNITLRFTDTTVNGVVSNIDNRIHVNGSPAAADEDGIIWVYRTDTVQIENSVPYSKPNGKAYKVTITSSDSSVLKVKGINKEDKTLTDLVADKSGTAILTILVDDSFKNKSTLTVKVLDNTAKGVYTDVSALKFNSEKDGDKQCLRIYNGLGSDLKDVYITIPKGSKADAEIDGYESDGTVRIEAFSAGKIILNAVMDGINETVQIPVTVSVSAVKPTITVKQIQKYNLFLGSNEPAIYKLNAGSETITKVNLVGLMPSKNGKLNDYSYDTDTGILKLYTKPAGNANAYLKVAGYKNEYTKSISISTVNESYKLSSSSVSIFSNASERAAFVNLYDNNNKCNVDLQAKGYNFTFAKKNTASNTRYDVFVNGKDIVIRLLSGDIPSSGEKLSLTLCGADTTLKYDNIKPFDITIKPGNYFKAELGLSSSSPVLYSYGDVYNYINVGVFLKGNASENAALSNLTVTETTSPASKAAGDNMLVSYSDGIITVKKNSRNLAAGTYSYRLTVTDPGFKSGKITTTLKVRVVDTSKSSSAPKVTFKTTGSVDVLNRAEDYILYTPTFTNIPADAVVLDAKIAGRDASVFDYVREGNNLRLSLKKDAEAVLINHGYQVYGMYTLDVGGCSLTVSTPIMTVKLKQGTVKITAAGSTAFSNMKTGSNSIIFAATAGDNRKVSIENVVLTDGYSGAFRLDKNVETGEMTICHTPDSATKRGGGYNLRFAVYPQGRAANAKPQYITIRVTVIK